MFQSFSPEKLDPPKFLSDSDCIRHTCIKQNIQNKQQLTAAEMSLTLKALKYCYINQENKWGFLI